MRQLQVGSRYAVLLLATFLALPAVAVGEGNERRASGEANSELEGPELPPWRQAHLERVAEFLDLSPDQIVQWDALRAEHRAATQDRLEAARDLRERLHEMAAEEQPDYEAIGRAVVSTHREMEALRVAHEDHEAALAEFLTPEQLERFETLSEEREELGRRHRGDRHRSRQGRNRHRSR